MIAAQITNRNFAVVLRSANLIDQRVMAAAAVGLERGLLQAVGVIQTQYLQGPRPQRLGERTTRLRASIAHQVTVNQKGAVGRVGTNVQYAAYHEFGFSGSVAVRAHTRVIRVLNKAGLPVSNRRKFVDAAGRFIGWRDSMKQVASRAKSGVAEFQSVRAHTRQVNYKGRPFIRPGLEQSLPAIQSAVETELARMPT